MINKRLEFHGILEDILGSTNVYFQKPSNTGMRYPAILYTLSNINNDYASNDVYLQNVSYDVTLIDRDPDSVFVKALSTLPKSRFSRFFVSENLNHFTFTIYY